MEDKLKNTESDNLQNDAGNEIENNNKKKINLKKF